MIKVQPFARTADKEKYHLPSAGDRRTVSIKFQVHDQVHINVVEGRGFSTRASRPVESTGSVLEFNGDTLIVSAPIQSGQTNPLCSGQAVHVRRALHEAWRQEGIITKCTEGGSVCTAEIKMLRSEKIERREFVRIRLNAEVQYAKIDAANTADPEWKHALLRDVSGGGARLLLWEKLELKENLFLELPIDSKPIRLRAVVQRVQPAVAQSNGAKQFDVGLEFVGIQESDRNKIVSLVFRLQLKFQRQKAQNVV